ncbi:glycoside hydrolase family 88/105 protein [Puia sp. P3]|uniref:glycoside hydrolase family 88/105 protein n=1 Tax=Puia sp. P3 TaxID=3423952 RepID=UPI003D66F3CC
MNWPSRLLLLALLLGGATTFAQDNSPETLVRKVADHIIQTTSFRFTNTKTGEKYESTKGLASSPDVKAESKFNKWMYVNGVLAVGMTQTAAVLKDARYSDYARKNYDFIFSNLDYFKKIYDGGTTSVEYRPVMKIGSLDDCGSMAAGLLDVYSFDKKPEYLDYLRRVGDYIISKQVKFPDGTLARNGPRKMTLWADDLYMSVPFLARMGKMTGDNSYLDFAVRQVLSFNHYIYDSASGLYFHVFYNDENTNGVAHWGRCNGWIALAQSALLDQLPANHPQREQLRKMLLRQIIGFSRYQDTSGMWHQPARQTRLLSRVFRNRHVHLYGSPRRQQRLDQPPLPVHRPQWLGRPGEEGNGGRRTHRHLHRHQRRREYPILLQPPPRNQRYPRPRSLPPRRHRTGPRQRQDLVQIRPDQPHPPA